MANYYDIASGYGAVGDDKLNTVLDWYNDVHEAQRSDINGAGNEVDAWRHGGVAALVAFERGITVTVY